MCSGIELNGQMHLWQNPAVRLPVLRSLVRLASAHAVLHQRMDVTAIDAVVAIALVEETLLARSGQPVFVHRPLEALAHSGAILAAP